MSMSHRLTEFVRLYAWSGHTINQAEADWIKQRIRDDYRRVKVRLARNLSYLDIDTFGGIGFNLHDFWAEYQEQYGTMWTRYNIDGITPADVIVKDALAQGYQCRYGFDEVRVESFDRRDVRKLIQPGGYLALNDGLPGETNHRIMDVEPAWVATFFDKAVVKGEQRVELVWRGHRVHLAENVVTDGRWVWRHTCEDTWDNCVDPDFLAFQGQ